MKELEELNKMNLTDLFTIQKYLDDKIEKKHPQLSGEDRGFKRTLALQVEFNEFLNELPELFKFWSFKKNNYQKALEEYVDCVHFLLSIGLHYGYENEIERWVTYECETTRLQVLEINESLLMFYSTPSLDNYKDLFEAFAGFGSKLGFSWEQIKQAYLAKNEINHSRQAEGY